MITSQAEFNSSTTPISRDGESQLDDNTNPFPESTVIDAYTESTVVDAYSTQEQAPLTSPDFSDIFNRGLTKKQFEWVRCVVRCVARKTFSDALLTVKAWWQKIKNFFKFKFN